MRVFVRRHGCACSTWARPRGVKQQRTRMDVRAASEPDRPGAVVLESTDGSRKTDSVDQNSDDSSSSTNDAPSTSSSSPITSSSTSSNPQFMAMALLAGCGATETAYLTAAKLLTLDVACPVTGACSSVLNSPYALLFGLPLPLFGAGAYGAVAALCAFGAREAAAGRELAPVPRLALSAGAGALATTSAYLMYVLHTALAGAPCAWCYASAGLSFSIAGLLFFGMSSRQLLDAAGPSLGAMAATSALLVLGFSPGEGAAAAGGMSSLPYAKPDVTQESSPQAVALAKRLREAGAAMYGAFWCSHCFEQEQAFGRQAMAEFPYVECFPEGFQRGAKLAAACEAVPVEAFPTWVIGGEVIEGEMDFDEITAALDAQEQAAAAAAAAAAPAAEAAEPEPAAAAAAAS